MIKRQVYVIFLLLPCLFSFAQNTFRHPSSFGIHFILNDFRGNRIFSGLSSMDAGLAISYLHRISSHIDYSVNAEGSFPDSISKAITPDYKKHLLMQGSFQIRWRVFGKDKVVNPFLFSAAGASLYRQKPASFLQLGPGIEFNYKDMFLCTSFGYRFSLSDNLNSHYFYSIGIAGTIGKNKKRITKEIKPVVVITASIRDRDGDGIRDSLDACPDVPGLQKFNGCPDSDGDGIEDRLDQCPTVFGLERYHGCPIPDRDKDGINDEEDQCPDTYGVIRYHGCPVPDSDSDGVNDDMDSCRLIPGAKENNGCPLIKKEIKDKIDLAASQIFFKTGSFELLSKSFNSLNEVVILLKENPSLTISVEGHTDNVGGASRNQLLSENRAKAVMHYLVKNGIEPSRLSALGYGSSTPIDSNETEIGRARNRRVELKIVPVFKWH